MIYVFFTTLRDRKHLSVKTIEYFGPLPIGQQQLEGYLRSIISFEVFSSTITLVEGTYFSYPYIVRY